MPYQRKKKTCHRMTRAFFSRDVTLFRTPWMGLRLGESSEKKAVLLTVFWRGFLEKDSICSASG